jgi:hypothetical protein
VIASPECIELVSTQSPAALGGAAVEEHPSAQVRSAVSSARVVVDSSGWIEMFTNGGQAEHVLVLMADAAAHVVPAICISEVFKEVVPEYREAQLLMNIIILASDLRGIADVE